MMMIVALAAGRVGNVLIIQDKDMHAKYSGLVDTCELIEAYLSAGCPFPDGCV
jgi:hypothetical protein